MTSGRARERFGLVVVVATLSLVAVPAPGVAAERDLCDGASALPAAGTDFRVPTRSGEVWALPLGAVPATAGEMLKVVWRVTGKGPIQVRFRDPSGDRHPLEFGPDLHGASTFQHPGREWGTGFAFDAPGCWTVQVRRTGTVATVGVRVT